jgi:hypothetical protein
MVNPIVQTLMTDETHHGLPLQVTQLVLDFVYRISFLSILCIRNHLNLLRKDNFEGGNSWFYQRLKNVYFLNLYHKTSVCGSESEKKTSRSSRKINVQCQPQSRTRRYDWGYQGYTEPNWLNSSEDINVWWKLYRSIFGKDRYTSLELAMRLDALMPKPIANFLPPILPRLEVERNINKNAIDYGDLASNYS